MEVDVIILPKDNSKEKLQQGMKRAIKNVLNKLYNNLQDESFQYDLAGECVNIKYQLSSPNANMIFVKFECEYTPTKSAKVLDYCINKLIQGEHRKDWNIIITYDEVSQFHCCKLMPLFGTFERRTRELVYITIIKIFGVEWYEKSFSESLQNTLKGKGNKTKLVEGALNELTYEQLKEYLFVPFSSQNFSEVLESELAEGHIESMSKEEITSIIDKCRSISLWDRFFGKYKKFQNFKEKIDELQPYRNIVMHHKRITRQEYEKVRKSLKTVNKLLVDAINVLEEDIYTETSLVDVVSALGNVISNILGDCVPKWIDSMKSALASLGKVVIEAAMPQINIPDLMPKLTLGEELSQRFRKIYNVPQIDSSGMKMASEMAEQVSRLRTMYKIPEINNIMENTDALNMTAVRIQNEMVAQVKDIKSMFEMPTIERLTATEDTLNSYDKLFSDEMKEGYNRISYDLESDRLIENNEEKRKEDLDAHSNGKN